MIFHSTKTRLSIVLLTGLLVVVISTVAWACPTCKDNLGSADSNLAGAYGWSIVFMMSMPFLILGSFVGYMYLEVRRARLKQQQEQSLAAELTTREPRLENIAGDDAVLQPLVEEQPLEV